MRIQIELTGITPLVMHNVRLSDPLDDYAKEISKLSSKKKKTEEDHLAIGRLEFAGGLYVNAGEIVMPCPNIKRCLNRAAVIRRLGKDVERALHPLAQEVPLIYGGPRSPEDLWNDVSYRFRTTVRVGASRVQRTRPRFPKWKVISDWELLTDIIDLDDLVGIGNDAGIIEGLGDHRSQGSGRFDAKITVARG